MNKVIIALLLVSLTACQDKASCEVVSDCAYDDNAECVNIKYANPDVRIADDPGCACENGRCAKAACEGACLLG